MTASGRKRTLILAVFAVSERPLSGKADIRRPTEKAQSRSAYNSTILPPLPGSMRRFYFGASAFFSGLICNCSVVDAVPEHEDVDSLKMILSVRMVS